MDFFISIICSIFVFNSKTKIDMDKIGIEITMGTRIFIDGVECEVRVGRACSRCEIQKMTSCRTNSQGHSMKCGTREHGNTTDFICSKDDRTDKKDIIFERI